MVNPTPAVCYPPAVWRLLLDREADGATNMAVDAAILEAVVDGASPPTLRFYSWSPPCLSLGRNQPLSDADLVACRALGVDSVRRPSGGRAILHTDELTYSVALLQADPRATGDVAESYRRLSEGLLSGLRSLDVEVVQVAAQSRPTHGVTPVCFDTPSDYEITAGGRKLVGSAQWRARGGILQHGSLPLYGDLARIVDVLSLDDAQRAGQREAVHTQAATLQAVLGHRLDFTAVALAVAQGFAQALNVRLEPADLTAHERGVAARLRESRYAAAEWLARA